MKFLLLLLIPFSIYCQSVQLGIKINSTGAFYSKPYHAYKEIMPYEKRDNVKPLKDFEVGIETFLLSGISLELNGDNSGLEYSINLLNLRTTLMELGVLFNSKFYKDLYALAGMSYIFTFYSEEVSSYYWSDLSSVSFNIGLGYDITKNFSINARYFLIGKQDYLSVNTINGKVLQNKLNNLFNVDFTFKIDL